MRRLSAARSFSTDARGIAATEFALLAPFLLVLIFTGFTLFELLRASYVADKATYTVGDLISRQSETDDTQLGQISAIYRHLAIDHSDAPQLRITSLIRRQGGFEVDWTYASPNHGELAKSAIPLSSLPDVAMNDSVLLTETKVTVNPFMDILPIFGGATVTFAHEGASRPRFVGRLVKTD